MSRQMKIAGIILVVLLGSAAVFAVLNYQSLQEKKDLQNSASFKILTQEEEYTVSVADIENIGIQDIKANYKPSGKAPVERTYQGVPFADILGSLDIDTSSYQTVTFTAADGYATAISIDEAVDPEICAIVTKLDNQPLGKKEEGGSGPLMMILPKDQFSQRWCKFLMEVQFS